MRFDCHDPLSSEFVSAIEAALDRYFSTERDLLAPVGDRLDPVWEQAQHFIRGGKHIRPAFCYWGYVAAAGYEQLPPAAVLEIAASLDLLHLAALVHDDLIDQSDSRRGGPSAHRFFQFWHNQNGLRADDAHFGRSAALLFGDLLLSWSMSMVEQTSIAADRLKRARPYLDAVRTEVLAGQYLDLLHQARPFEGVDLLREAGLVMGFKTAKYTVARPLQIGAALGLAASGVQQGLSAFGTHVGYAFQMRDDLLGLFGDPQITGKPTGDDLREGKKTVVIGYALQGASAGDAQRLRLMLGDPTLTDDQVDEACQIVQRSGAVEATEKAIMTEATAGMKYLQRLDISPTGADALSALVHACVERIA
ncbi:MAG: polyprenyl synthetase family protein [Propionibacteriaceae bacterium]|jgi:geranylgeranyl diphosphate synthase type I|nr:polyprenyl synthetase family protein [Propionibacteriaceae bacterium]